MKIAIIGASGFVGRALVNEALNENHYIYAISRSGVFEQKPSFESIHCDVFNERALENALIQADLVISAYNSGWNNPNLYDDFMNGSKHIIEVIKKTKKRVVFVGGASSLLLPNNQPLISQMGVEWKDKVKGAYDLLTLLRNDLTFDWTFISPAQEILPLDTHERYNVGGDYVLYNAKGRSQITVADLAHFIIHNGADEANIHKRLTVSNI